MIRIADLSMPLGYTGSDLRRAAAKKLRLAPEQLKGLTLVRRSVDARRKSDVKFIVTVDVQAAGSEDKLLSRLRDGRIRQAPVRSYEMPRAGALSLRPVVVGFGPAGMFAGLLLARAGLRPIIVERGGAVEDRQVAVQRFWRTRALDGECNVQFGEGGAGTFSDGKLNTGTKDERIFFVLQTLAEHGAPEEILFDAKPHVGTDRLPQTVRAIREEIKILGGTVRFHTKMADLLVRVETVRRRPLFDAAARQTQDTVRNERRQPRDRIEQQIEEIDYRRQRAVIEVRIVAEDRLGQEFREKDDDDGRNGGFDRHGTVPGDALPPQRVENTAQQQRHVERVDDQRDIVAHQNRGDILSGVAGEYIRYAVEHAALLAVDLQFQAVLARKSDLHTRKECRQQQHQDNQYDRSKHLLLG